MRIDAEAGGAVMATGIVSVAIHFEGVEILSRVLLAVCAGAWAVLAALVLLTLLVDFRQARDEVRRPAALTAVAATAVLGVRLTLLGWSWAGWTLLVIASALPALLLPVLARAGPLPRTGGSFLVVVALQSLAVLAATVGASPNRSWPALAALAPCALGLATYPLVLARFDVNELRHGAGDHWVSGGALAISTLACAQIAHALSVSRGAIGLHEPLRVTSVVLWAVTVAWLPALVAAEARWPRPGYDVRRWATVFPLGMYSVMSTATGTVAGADGLLQFGHVAAWVALAAWTATFLGWARRQPPLIRRQLPPARQHLRLGPGSRPRRSQLRLGRGSRRQGATVEARDPAPRFRT